MIDGLFKTRIDRLWEAAARPLARTGMTPNQVTAAGLLLVLVCCALMFVHGSYGWFGASLAIAFSFDALDGAVARLRNLRSKVGGYFDAIVDRYQELAVIGTLAACVQDWRLAFAAFSGSVLISYAKARCALETPVENDAWPDFFERTERVVFIVVMLLAAEAGGAAVVWWGLALFAALCHLTAIQRALRAAALLRDRDRASRR